MHRRSMLAGLGAAALGAAVLPPRLALAAGRLPLAAAFPLLDAYLALPPSARSRFYFAYRAVRNFRPAPDARAVMIAPDGSSRPVSFDQDGVIDNPPTLADLRSGATFQMEGAPFKIGLELRAIVPLATRIDVRALALALAQANAAVAKLARGRAASAGTLTDAYFPGAGFGDALLRGGAVQPLPIFAFPDLGAVPYCEPAQLAGTGILRLARPPSRVLLGGPPRKS